MQLINIVVLIWVLCSFNCFSDGMFRQPNEYKGQPEYWGKKIIEYLVTRKCKKYPSPHECNPNILYILGPTSFNVLHRHTRPNRDAESNESVILSFEQQQLIYDFFIKDYIRKFILRLFPELKDEKNRLLADYMTNELFKNMKTIEKKFGRLFMPNDRVIEFMDDQS